MGPRHLLSKWHRAGQLVSPGAGREEGVVCSWRYSPLSARRTAVPVLISMFSSYIHNETLSLQINIWHK